MPIRGIIKEISEKRGKYLEDEMFRFAANLEFEAAQNVKEKIRYFRRLSSEKYRL